MTQTAVEWLKGMLEWNYGDPQMLEITWENLDDLLERAKQMEKEQMLGFHKWMKENDTADNAEKYFHDSDEDMLNEYFKK